jgi:asparagine synthase (glutamine-hydrolysing)
MCGICGSTDDPDASVTSAMSARLVHRGPDDDGLHVDEAAGVAFGARRLSIIDVAGGHQPLANEDGSVWAALNGEIYNYPALRERLRARGHRLATATDTEVLVHLYEDHGPEFVHALEGMFALAIWDAARGRLLLARDRHGEKPLFYAENEGGLAFASELGALGAIPGGLGELDPGAIDRFFVFGYPAGPRTMFTRARELVPGHRLVWDSESRQTDVVPYWQPPRPVDGPAERHRELQTEMTAILDRSVQSRLLADVPVGVFLSGGVDSALVAALAAPHVDGPLHTFTVGYSSGGVNEFAEARSVASAIGTEHRELTLSDGEIADRSITQLAALDQPLGDPALVPLGALSEFARTEVKVAVGGEGADELFSGYPRYRWLSLAHRLDGIGQPSIRRALVRALRASSEGRVRRLAHIVGPEPLLSRHLNWVSGERHTLRGAIYGSKLAGEVRDDGALAELSGLLEMDGDIPGAFMRLDQVHWLPYDVLAKADRASMSASLELRTPYLHHELTELAAGLPARLRTQRGGKPQLREMLRELVPELDLSRPKVAFRVPVAEWLRGPLAAALRGQVRHGTLYDGWFDRVEVGRLAAEHLDARADHSSTLWPLLALGIWLDERS